MAPFRYKSINLPGVEITKSTPACTSSICVLGPNPPYKLTIRRPVYLARCWATSSICMTNSRVGASTKPRGCMPWAYLIFINRGKRYAAVLPVPVWAIPNTSCPAKAKGMVFSWIGVGIVYPDSATASSNCLFSLKASNPCGSLLIGKREKSEKTRNELVSEIQI